MNIKTIKTDKFYPPKDSYEKILSHLGSVSNGSIAAVSSKVLAICEGRCLLATGVDKDELVRHYAQKVLVPKQGNQNHMELTQTNGLLIESAGIDRSNADDYYILPLRNPYVVARKLWIDIRRKARIKDLGIIITDSHSLPGRRGAIGMAIASFGFRPVKEYLHTKDVFGNRLTGAGADIVDALAAGAVLEMGEGGETTPIAIITDSKNIQFYRRGINLLRQRQFSYVPHKLDVYGPLLESKVWQNVKKG